MISLCPVNTDNSVKGLVSFVKLVGFFDFSESFTNPLNLLKFFSFVVFFVYHLVTSNMKLICWFWITNQICVKYP